MRIAFVAPLDIAVCDLTARGRAIVIADLARALAAGGHDVAVFCGQGSYLAGIETAPVLSGAGYAELAWHLERWAPDVVSVHSVEAEEALRDIGAPRVLTLHVNPDEAKGVPDDGCTCVAASRDSAQRWRAAGVHDVRTIPHGVPDLAASLRPERFAVVAGRIARDKGTAAAIRVARRAGLDAVVIGEVCDRAYFAREIVPLLSGTRMLRTLPRGRLMALMARAAVTIAPVARDEPFNLMAAESQLAGCPVVAYARGALPEIVTDGQGVLVAPEDEDALVGAVGAARALDRDAIRGRAVRRFDLHAMTHTYEAVLCDASIGRMRGDAAA